MHPRRRCNGRIETLGEKPTWSLTGFLEYCALSFESVLEGALVVSMWVEISITVQVQVDGATSPT